jgi:hypothetical protein
MSDDWREFGSEVTFKHVFVWLWPRKVKQYW